MVQYQLMRSNKQFTIQQQQLLCQLIEPLFYYDIFSYPLTLIEIVQFSKIEKEKYSQQQILEVLELMLIEGMIHQMEGFYLLNPYDSWVHNRKMANQRAKKMLPKAYKMAKLMSWFPFVRGVLVSGSLSKNVLPEDGDIDYFIITAHNRLWIARTALILFKKIFLLNSKKYFCVNYFVSVENLVIEEQNRFTATEIATVLPIYGQELYENFRTANNWTDSFYPNKSHIEPQNRSSTRKSLPQYLLEPLFSNRFGEWLDKKLLQHTLKHWNNKFEHLPSVDFELALKSRRNISKHHPQLFQRKVIQAFEERVQAFEQKYQLKLNIK